MATETVDERPSAERIHLALEAAWEIESIADAIIAFAQDLDAEAMAIRGMSIRLKDLGCIVMSALDDPRDALPGLMSRLTGMHQEAEHG